MAYLLILSLLVVAVVVWLVRRRNRLLAVDDVPHAHREHLKSEASKFGKNI